MDQAAVQVDQEVAQVDQVADQVLPGNYLFCDLEKATARWPFPFFSKASWNEYSEQSQLNTFGFRWRFGISENCFTAVLPAFVSFFLYKLLEVILRYKILFRTLRDLV